MDSLPPWLADGREPPQQCPKRAQKYRRSMTYFRQMHNATPSWLTDAQREEFYAIFRLAKMKRQQGCDVQVDHIVPLRHPYVSGLNVPWNLQIVSSDYNLFKSNNWWPNCPHEIADMFGEFEPQQLRLM